MPGSLSISGRDLEAIQAESERRLQAGLSQLAHARKQDHVLEELLKQWPHGAPVRNSYTLAVLLGTSCTGAVDVE